MLDILLTAVSAALCFFHPLLLTIKSLNNLSTTNDTHQINYLKFLFNYWIYYILINIIEGSLAVKLLQLSTLNFASPLFLVVKLWLFYGQGCLIMTHYYLNGFLGRFLNTRNNQLEAIEMRFVDPFSNLFLLNSFLVSKPLSILYGMTGPNNILGSMVGQMNYFVHSLQQNELRNPYFLNKSLEAFCTIDNQHTYRQYVLTNNLLNMFTPKEAPALAHRKPRSSSLHSKSSKFNRPKPADYVPRTVSNPVPRRAVPPDFRSVSDGSSHHTVSPGRSRSSSTSSAAVPLSMVMDSMDHDLRSKSPRSTISPPPLQVTAESMDMLMTPHKPRQLSNDLPELPYPVRSQLPSE